MMSKGLLVLIKGMEPYKGISQFLTDSNLNINIILK
jgi:hypothetical protein